MRRNATFYTLASEPGRRLAQSTESRLARYGEAKVGPRMWRPKADLPAAHSRAREK